MNKHIIIDTNVLIEDPYAIHKFEENTVVIPLVVLEELDKQKSSDRDISRDARAAIRTLNEVIRDFDPLQNPVALPNGGELVVAKPPIALTSNDYITPTCNDDHIINIAKMVQMYHGETILVSNDVCMRLKAKGIGVKHTQEYHNNIVIDNPDLLPKGYVNVPDGWLTSLPTGDVTVKSCGETHIKRCHVEELLTDDTTIAVNDWLINEQENFAMVLLGQHEEDENIMVFEAVNVEHQLMHRKAAGIAPRNLVQAMALDALLDPDIDIVVMDGEAGSGKTLMAMAAAVEMVKGKKRSYRMNEIIFSRSNDTQFKEIGFLKGDEKMKMQPWLMGCVDNLEVIATESKNKKFHPSVSIASDEPNDDAFVQLKALNFMRGRSLNHRIFIVDEIQNLNRHQIKTLITRAGAYCKVILMGNNGQIDNPTISPRSSALTYATEKLHGVPFAKVIKLNGVVRSRLAEFAEAEM